MPCSVQCARRVRDTGWVSGCRIPARKMVGVLQVTCNAYATGLLALFLALGPGPTYPRHKSIGDAGLLVYFYFRKAAMRASTSLVSSSNRLTSSNCDGGTKQRTRVFWSSYITTLN